MDLSLAATVLLFVTALGIFPTPKPSVENLMADSAHMKKVVRQSSVRVAAKPMPVMLSNNRATKVQATKPSKDNLATLRDAWGG